MFIINRESKLITVFHPKRKLQLGKSGVRCILFRLDERSHIRQGAEEMFRIITVTMVMLLALTSSALCQEPVVELILPFDKAIISAPNLNILFKNSFGLMPKITLNDEDISSKVIEAPCDKEVGEFSYRHLELSLKEGSNNIIWVNPETEKRLLSLTLYHIPRHSSKMVRDPEAKEFLFHVSDFELKCSRCHEYLEKSSCAISSEPVGGGCMECHKEMKEGPVAHKPVEDGICLVCHDNTFSPNRFEVKAQQAELCRRCHEEYMVTNIENQRFLHGPVAVGRCLDCHSVHYGERKLIISDESQELCFECHRPFGGDDDDESLHTEETCDSCHTPHASDTARFLNNDVNDLCLGCHDTIAYGEHAAMGEHTTSAPVNPENPARPFTCISCHTAHGGKDIVYKYIFEGVKSTNDFCNRCHANE